MNSITPKLKMQKPHPVLDRITFVLFILILIELSLGGGGRLTAVGPISLRMIFFSMALLLSAVHFVLGKRLSRIHATLLSIFCVVLILGLTRGILSGAGRKFWWEDVKPLAYFFILPFFFFALQDLRSVRLTASILKSSGAILAASFLALLLLIHTNIIPFQYFYQYAIRTEEFFFRGELTFFYKGFLFLCIGFLFTYFTGRSFRRLWLIVEGVTIVLTVTRGLWLALLCALAIFDVINMKKKAIVLIALACVVLFFGPAIIASVSKFVDVIQSTLHGKTSSTFDTTLLGDRTYSDNGRVQQIKEVFNSITFSSFLIGHGFGIGVPSRPVHMEISYAEIFHKQGIIGIAFWLFLLCQVWQQYRRAKPGNLREAYFFSCVFVFAQSLTNQYINNPIGLSMVLLCLVCLEKLQVDDNRVPLATHK